LKIKQFLTDRLIRGRKPWSLASDIIFFALIILFLIPSTRSQLLSGVAIVRTWISGTGDKGGQPAALDAESWNWTLTDDRGTATSFSSLKGEVIFLNQWATWCPPCRAEMPSIEKLYKDYGDRVRFVMLTNEEPAPVLEYMKKHGYTFPVSFGSVAGPGLATRSIPVTVIIGREGQVLINKKGAINWNARKIRKLLDRAI
jgi:thiol-disulfide isomerase/thioredoxin